MFEEYAPNFKFITFPDEVKRVYDLWQNCQDIDTITAPLDKTKKIALFGAGLMGMNAIKTLQSRGYKIDYFIDNSPQKIGKEFHGIPIISVNDLSTIADTVNIFITSAVYLREIILQLHEKQLLYLVKGVLIAIVPGDFEVYKRHGLGKIHDAKGYLVQNKDSIDRVFSLLADEQSKNVFYGMLNFALTNDNWYLHSIKDIIFPQYFDKDILTFSEDECFVDAGVFDGNTTTDFISQVNNKFRKALLFEPDPNCYSMLVNRFSENKDSRISITFEALYEKKTTIGFGGPLVGASIDDSCEQKVQTTTLDKFFEEGITFVKMDIEGSEMSALKGGTRVIRESQPQLAICVYHKPSDLWDIPLYIHDLNPKYRIYLRHYSDYNAETVCYATTR